MQFQEISSSVADLMEKNKIVLFYANPEIIDFSSEQEGKICIHGSGKKIEIILRKDNVKFISALLENSFFSDGMSVITWNIKPLISYLTFFTQNPIKIAASVIDLKIVERFKGLESSCPKSLVEAINRYRNLGEASWIPLYKSIHLPLALKVLPFLETYPLINKLDKSLKYSFYEIEGQKNGRLQAYNNLKNCYNPHSLSQEESANITVSHWDYMFGHMDFKHMEVTMLQHLSKDERLLEMLLSGQDLYKEIYKLLFNEECDSEEKRDKLKLIFLPVMYGLGAKTLHETFSLQFNVAEDIIYKIQSTFSTAYSWIKGFQECAAESGKATDCLNRTRFFTNPYKARNFAIQSPSAMFCLEKLIDLYHQSDSKCRVVYSVHDGYVFICEKNHIKDGFYKFKNILESPSKLIPDLKLKVKIKIGKSLDKMKVIGEH